MANIIILLGPSGTGKSTSIKGLDPKSTMVFNTLKKRLPFKGSVGLYNSENKNILEVTDYDKAIAYLNAVGEKMPHIKNLIIDDSIYIMRKEFFDRAKENGFNKFTDLAVHFQRIISTCESLRDDLNVFLILHSEPVYTDGVITTYKVATVGKLLDEKYNPIEVVPMVLYSAQQFVEGKPNYGFYTHATQAKGAIIPAKTPDGMFEDDFIPNDLGYVVRKMEEYYA